MSAQPVPPPQHIEITGHHILRIVYDVSFTWPGGSDEHAVFYLPVPPQTGCQRIDHFSSTFKGQPVDDPAIPPRRILRGTLSHDRGDDRQMHWRIEATGLFQTRQLVDGPPPPNAPPIIAPAEGEFLASTESINWKSDAFASWLDQSGLRRQQGETALAFGHRVYQYYKDHGHYEYPPEGGWKADTACQRLHTDCGGFSLVFVATCRANKVPARLLVGNWFKTHENPDGSLEEEAKHSHVIAEFFDPQVGWIPEDISSTLMKIPGHDDYFGREPGYFFAWHTDTDFHFNVPRKADEHVQWIQNPSLWFSANADDACDSLSHRWTVESIR